MSGCDPGTRVAIIFVLVCVVISLVERVVSFWREGRW